MNQITESINCLNYEYIYINMIRGFIWTLNM